MLPNPLFSSSPPLLLSSSSPVVFWEAVVNTRGWEGSVTLHVASKARGVKVYRKRRAIRISSARAWRVKRLPFFPVCFMTQKCLFAKGRSRARLLFRFVAKIPCQSEFARIDKTGLFCVSLILFFSRLFFRSLHSATSAFFLFAQLPFGKT